MNPTRPAHPRVVERRGAIHFALQVATREDDPTPSKSVLAAGRLADELGFDGFHFNDHPTWSPECWLHLAALALTTKRIRLGPLATCVLYRPPVMTARLAADLDQLSDGRLGCV